MGLDALKGNGITTKIRYLIRDRTTVPSNEPLRRVRRSRTLLFVAIQVIGFGATMAITQTIGVFDSPVRCPYQGYSVIDSRDRFSDRDIAAHTLAYDNNSEAPVYR
jgi:hypothetical protein